MMKTATLVLLLAVSFSEASPFISMFDAIEISNEIISSYPSNLSQIDSNIAEDARLSVVI